MVFHENTVECWDNQDESSKRDHGHNGHGQQTQGQFSADESSEGQEDCGSQDDAQRPKRQIFLDLEDRTVSRLAVPQVGQGDTEKIIKTVSVRMVAVIPSALTAEPQVPFP